MDNLKSIGEVAKITGLSVRKIKYYSGESKDDTRDPKYFRPSSQSQGGTRGWKYSDEDIRKIKYIRMLELLDYSPSEIKAIMSHEDYIGHTNYRKLTRQLEEKIKLYQGLLEYADSLARRGTELLDKLPVRMSGFEKFIKMTQDIQTDLIGDLESRFERMPDSEKEQIFEKVEYAFKEMRSLFIGGSRPSQAYKQASELYKFFADFTGLKSPILFYLFVSWFPSIPEAAEFIRKVCDDDVYAFISDATHYYYLVQLHQALKSFEKAAELPIDSSVHKETLDEILLVSCSIDGIKFDLSVMLTLLLTDQRPWREINWKKINDKTFDLVDEALEQHYGAPIKTSIRELAILRSCKANRREALIKARDLYLCIQEKLGEKSVQGAKWYAFLFGEYEPIRQAVDQWLGSGSSDFILESMNMYEDLLRKKRTAKHKEENANAENC